MKKILNKIKEYKKNNSRGFTLIEMIGVIVIMGLIMIVVFPTMSKMIHNNNNQEYTNYYQMIEEGAQAYAGTLTDKLGTSKYSGCAEATLDDLINKGYVQKFNDNKVTCKLGTGNIKIRNDKGRITINFQLNCSGGGKNTYVTGTNDTNACKANVMKEEKNIKTVLDGNSTLGTSTVGNDVYVTSANPNNYIWYSGKLWRVISYNKVTEVVKAVTADSMTSIYYNHTTTSSYLGSDVETWLDNEFMNSLKDNQVFLTSTEWNYAPNTSVTTNPTTTDKIKKSKIGLITTFDFGKIKAWYGSTPTWVLSEGTSNQNLVTNSSGSVSSVATTTIYPIRPVVTFSSDVLVDDGSGTSSSPYIIDTTSNAKGAPNDLINTRFSGEYVRVGTKDYRIVSTDGVKTKLISMTSLGNFVYSDNHFDYSSSSMRTSVEGNATFTASNVKDLITTGDFCLDTINNGNLVYQSSKCIDPTRVNNSIRVGLPKIGDIFTTNLNGIGNYWTVNPNTEKDGSGTHYGATMNIVTPTGNTSTSVITSSNAVVPVIYLNSDVKITGGNGMSTSPYTVSK